MDENGLQWYLFSPSCFTGFLREMHIFSKMLSVLAVKTSDLLPKQDHLLVKKSSETASGYSKRREKWSENTSEGLVMHQSQAEKWK